MMIIMIIIIIIILLLYTLLTIYNIINMLAEARRSGRCRVKAPGPEGAQGTNKIYSYNILQHIIYYTII